MSREPRQVTHEIADCLSTVKSIPEGTHWEPCWVVGTNVECHDVEIVCDNVIVHNVPKRFVRQIKISTNRLWSDSKVRHLRQIMIRIKEEILQGNVMPGSYIQSAVELFQKSYPSMSRKQIDNKWNDMVDRGRERAVVSKKNREMKVSSETVTTTVKTDRPWTSVEYDVLVGILTGPEGLFKEGTIPKNVFQCAAVQCKMRGVKRKLGHVEDNGRKY